MAFGEGITVEALLRRTMKDLDNVTGNVEQLGEAYNNLHNELTAAGLLDTDAAQVCLYATLDYMLGIKDVVDDWNRYVNAYKEVVIKQRKEDDDIAKQVEYWRGRAEQAERQVLVANESVNQAVKTAGKVCEEAGQIVNDSKQIINDTVNSGLLSRANSLMDVFERRVEVLANTDNFVRHCKAPKSGETAPKFIQEISTEELVDLYEKNGYKLTDDIVQHFNKVARISWHGLRERLIQAGVWKGRQ